MKTQTSPQPKTTTKPARIAVKDGVGGSSSSSSTGAKRQMPALAAKSSPRPSGR